MQQREPLDALTAVVQGLVQCRAGGERAGVGVIAVQVGEQARYRARLRRDDLRERDGMRALAEQANTASGSASGSITTRSPCAAISTPAQPSHLSCICRLLWIVDVQARRSVFRPRCERLRGVRFAGGPPKVRLAAPAAAVRRR